MAAYPKDRFDELPEDLARVGAHRGPRKKGRGWIGFAWALLAVFVLTFGGLYAVSRYLDIDLGIPFLAPPTTPTPTPTPTPTAEPVTDPTTIDPARNIKINVLNGTAVVGVQNTVADALRAASWPIGTALNAAEKDIENTTVYYSDPANEDIARGLVVALGLGEIRLVPAETFPGAPLTIVIGSDYATVPPAGG